MEFVQSTVTAGTIMHLAKENGFDIREAESNIWEDPRPFTRELAPGQPFPVEALGPVLSGAARELHRVIKAPEAICAQSVLAAANVAVQPFANVVVDGRITPISNFYMSIGASGERKSAVDQQALKSHQQFQFELTAKYKIELGAYKNLRDAFDSKRKQIIKNPKGDPQSIAADLASLGFEPELPLESTILPEEPTYEGLVKLLQNGQPSIGLFSDEGGRFIGGHAMNDDNKVKTAAGFCGLWDGKPQTRTRVGDGNIILHGRRLSAHLMVQPTIASLALTDPILLNQGLLSRFLITWPQSTIGQRLYTEVDLDRSEPMISYWRTMSMILNTTLPIVAGERNVLAPRKLGLSPEAKRVWIDFHDEVEGMLASGGAYEFIVNFANKAPEHVCRLATVLALVNNIQCQQIDAQFVIASIAILKHYLNENVRLKEAGMEDPELANAARLLEWLKLRRLHECCLRDIYQGGPQFVRHASTARRCMSILVEHNYAKLVKKDVYKLHPSLLAN